MRKDPNSTNWIQRNFIILLYSFFHNIKYIFNNPSDFILTASSIIFMYITLETREIIFLLKYVNTSFINSRNKFNLEFHTHTQ